MTPTTAVTVAGWQMPTTGQLRTESSARVTTTKSTPKSRRSAKSQKRSTPAGSIMPVTSRPTWPTTSWRPVWPNSRWVLPTTQTWNAWTTTQRAPWWPTIAIENAQTPVRKRLTMRWPLWATVNLSEKAVKTTGWSRIPGERDGVKTVISSSVPIVMRGARSSDLARSLHLLCGQVCEF